MPDFLHPQDAALFRSFVSGAVRIFTAARFMEAGKKNKTVKGRIYNSLDMDII